MTLFLIIAASSLTASPPALPAGSSFELRGTVENCLLFSQGIWWRQGPVKAFMVDIRKPGGESYTMGGIVTPSISVGPMKTGGLLREVDNPGAYLPMSPVFKESWFVRGDESLTKSPIWGGVIGNSGEGPSFFFFLNDDEIPRIGITASLNRARIFSVRAVVTYSEAPMPETSRDTWFLAAPMGGESRISLLHIAANTAFKPGILFGGAAFCSSFTNVTVPGYYGRLTLGIGGTIFTVETMLVLTDSHYVPPSRLEDDSGLTGSIKAFFTPWDWVRISGSYSANLREPNPLPSLYRESAETLETVASFRFFRGSFTISPSYSVRVGYNDLGEGILSQKAIAALGLKTDFASISLKASRSWELPEKKAITGLSSSFRMVAYPLDLRLIAGISREDKLFLSAGVRLGFSGLRSTDSALAYLDLRFDRIPADNPISSNPGETGAYQGAGITGYMDLTLGYQVIRSNPE